MDSVKIDNYFKTVDKLTDKYMDFIRKLCSINSKTEDKEGVDAVLAAVIEHEKENAYILKRVNMEKAGDVASLTYFCGEDKPTVCLSAHMDTVFPKETFSEPMVTEDEEKMYGPGVCDCKGNIALGFLTMAALKENGFEKANIKMILQSDEESSSSLSGKKTIDFMCSEAKNSIAFLNLETGGDDFVVISRYGIVRYRLDVFGQSAHAAEKMKGLGINAIKEAAYKIIEIENYETSNNLSFVVGMIDGGTAPNTIAEHCSFMVDCRVKTKDDITHAKNIITSIANKQNVVGTSCKVTEISTHYPMEKSEKNEQLFEVIKKVNKEYFNEDLTGIETGGGSDAAYPADIGIATVDGMGLDGGFLHTTNEYMVKASMQKRAKRLIATIYSLLSRGNL